MRPIKLSIKGLNSFVEEQVIDFNKLTDKGLFGIFGPTGSGKSTILDGITLALYGKTARDSSDFINANGESASIRYEFEIRENIVKHYIIDRSFKRNTSGGINAKKPTRIIELIALEEMILEDAPTKVDKKCIEIIGLKFEDFVRTVVLPQGKFSEFLKLEGTPKRDMLERLFSLGQYGDDLSRKLSQVIRSEKSQMDQLEGQLKVYEEVNEEVYHTKKQVLMLKEAEEKESIIKVKETLMAFSEGEILWNLQQELQKHELKAKELESQKQIIETYKIQAQQGENALKVKPYMDATSRTLKEIQQIEQKWEQGKILLQQLRKNKESTEVQFEQAKLNKEKKIPELKIIENNIEQALEEEEAKVRLEKEREILLTNYVAMQSQMKAMEKEITAYNEDIKTIDKLLEEAENEIEILKIDQKDRTKIQEGVLLQSHLGSIQKNKEHLEQNVKENKEVVKTLYSKLSVVEEELKQKKVNRLEEEKKLQVLMENAHDDANILLIKQEQLNNLKTTVQSGMKLQQHLIELQKQVSDVEALMDAQVKQKETIEKSILNLKEKIERIRQENLADILREGLHQGMPCPVCGAKEHSTIEIRDNYPEELTAYEELLEKEESKKRELENSILIYRTTIVKDKENKKQIEEDLSKLGEEWGKTDLALLTKQFEDMKQTINEWTQEKEQLETGVKSLSSAVGQLDIEYSKTQTAWLENQKSLEKYSKELMKVTQEYTKISEQLSYLEYEVGIKDFIQKDKEIKLIDKKRETLENTVTKNRLKRKEKEEKRQIEKEHVDSLVDALATIRTEGKAKKDQLEEKKANIKKKVGDQTDLKAYKEEVRQTLVMIENAFAKLEANKKQVETAYTQCEKEIEVGYVQLKALKTRLEEEQESLNAILKAQGFKDQEHVKECLKTEADIKRFKESIHDYEMQVSQLQGKLQEVKEKIKGRTLTEEEWEALKEQKQETEEVLRNIRTFIVQVQTEVKQLEKKLAELKGLLHTQKALEHKLSLLKDLEGLFKGKRFVEFVAMHQLKYIAMEASKRLKDITSGTYGLELDENGKFIIRDYKNGGATRDASTLSGGETFLASLSLALALSSQIQLKGRAPLELFFLDEGFGTLDDTLLDIVMNSLEKLHNDKLSVGIISHVESIKNRVPVKLLLTPAESGVGGSKVKLDRS